MKGQDNPLIPNPHPYLLNSAIKKPIIVPSSYQPKKIHKPRKAIRTTEISQSSGPINLVADETVYKEWEDIMERAAITASSLDAEQDSVDLPKGLLFPSMEILNTYIFIALIPKFSQILLNKHQRLLLPQKRTYVAPTLTQKLFSNMRRVSKGYTGVNILLFSSMLVQGPIQQGEGLTVLVESHHTPITTPSTSQPLLLSPSRVPTPPYDLPLLGGHTPVSDKGSIILNELTVLCTQLSTIVASLEQDLKQNKKVYSNAYTKLIMRVKKLEHKVKSRQPKRRARVVISDTEEDLEDPSKQGRRIAEIDQNPSISLVQDKGTSWIQEDAEIQERTSVYTEILLDQEEPIELVGDLGSGEKGEKEISTANISVSTASETPEVSTATENLVYIRRSVEKRKDKGKAIMKEDESVQKKIKKQLEQERLRHKEAIRLQEQINEEERQRIARDAEIAKQLQEEFDKARQEQEVVAKADQAHDIDWSDLVVLRYHALQNRSFFIAEVRKNMCMYLKNQGGYRQSHFKGMSYEDIRLIFERVWDQNHAFIPKDSEIEKEVMKRPGFDFSQKSIKKNDDSQQQAGSSKKRSREDSDEDNAKK
ncbi:hypothetical protein Tco_1577469 [Tanacetum coccineum]